tara:strand:+ start:563 stop:682 length:120 start_codon:yes stop_codon:yes gene_type:complete
MEGFLADMAVACLGLFVVAGFLIAVAKGWFKEALQILLS